jgi:murein DD-endopeptidase MepM/ murein hydrolase activator NlpD
MKFQLSYSVYPWALNQQWGTLDPKDYSQFDFTRHNGQDVHMGSDKLVRAPFAGTLVRTGNQPTGGGIFCGFLSDDTFDFDAFVCKTPALAADGSPDGIEISFPAAQARVLIDFLHLESISAIEGQHYNEGDVLAIQDNTGFSTGPHTHEQHRREYVKPIPGGMDVSPAYRVLGDNYLEDVDKNDANNSFDPTSFYTGTYAQTAATMRNLAEEANAVAAKIATAPIPTEQKFAFMQEIIDGFKKLFNL